MSHVGGYLSKNANCEITTVCDCDEVVIGPAMKHVEEKQGKQPKYEKDVRKVIADPNIDVISTATPNHWHALLSVWAMQNGKDVYVEKPASHNVREGRLMTEFARSLKRICQVGTQSRSSAAMREAIEYNSDLRIAQARAADRDAVKQLVAWCERDRVADDAEVRARMRAWIPEYAPPAGASIKPIPADAADEAVPLPLRAPRRR